MGAWASALQGVGNAGNDVSQGRQIRDQWNQQQVMDKLNAFTARARLQQLQQQLKNTPEAQLSAVEQALGRKLTDPEKSALLGITPAAQKELKTSWRVQPGPDGRPHDVLVNDADGSVIKVGDVHYEKPEKDTSTASFGTQSGKYATADGKSGYGYRDSKSGLIYDAASGQPVQARSFVPSAEQPTTTSGISFQTLTGPDGSQQVVAIPTTRTSGKEGGGNVSIGTPRPIGSKALPAATSEKLNSMIATTEPVLEAMKRMRQNADVLSHPMSAAKIGLATSSGGLAGLVSRGVSMTDQEKQYAADYETTAEGINALRQALQATGFRGPYAWDTLLQQRGTLFGRPDVTKKVLDQSIGILEGQLKQAHTMLGTGGAAPAQPAPMQPSVPQPAGGFVKNPDGSYTEQ